MLVNVPGSVSCALEGPDRGKRISEWASMGITRVSGKPYTRDKLLEQVRSTLDATRGTTR